MASEPNGKVDNAASELLALPDRAALWLFSFALGFAPLAFGTVEHWSYALLEVACFAGVGVCALRAGQGARQWSAVPGLVPLLLLAAFIALQLVPLPAALVRVLSPWAYAFYHEGPGVMGNLSWMPLTLNAKATLAELLRYLCLVAFYVLSVQLLTGRRTAKRTVRWLAYGAGVVAFLGILQYISAPRELLWLRTAPGDAKPFGPFVNRNHFASLMAMALPFCLAMISYYDPFGGLGGHREGRQARVERFVLALGAGLLCAVSIFLSRSRGGVIALGIALAVFLFMVALKKGTGKAARMTPLIVMVVLAVGWFGWGHALDRFLGAWDAHGDIEGMRSRIWSDTLAYIESFALAGSGFGSFGSVYPSFQSAWGGRAAVHAHNDYLELLSEGGLVSAALLAWAMVAALWSALKRATEPRSTFSTFAFAAAVSAIAGALVHATLDFNLHIGANALYMVFLFGFVAALCQRRQNGAASKQREFLASPRGQRVIKVGFSVLIVVAILFHSGAQWALGSMSFVQEARVTKGQLEPAMARELFNKASWASRIDPLEARWRSLLAVADTTVNGKVDAALYRTSLTLGPTDAEALQRAALALSMQGRHEQADALMRAGIARDKANPQRYEQYASWLFSRGRRTEALASMNQAMSLAPKLTRRFLVTLALNDATASEALEAAPDLAEVYVHMGEYFAQTEEQTEAAGAFTLAAGLMQSGQRAPLDAYMRLSRAFETMGQMERALDVMRTAKAALPLETLLMRRSGELYERMGMQLHAQEEYERALALDPGDSVSRQKLGSALK